MRVVRLEAENFKRLVAVDITPEGDMVVVGGRNAQGKTSVIDAIWAAVSARAASIDTPIRHGASTATVVVDFGEIVVTRTWKGDKSSLVVKTAAGAQVQSPQTLLDSLIGKLSFDPLAFANAKGDDQRAMLLSVVDLGFDLGELASQRKMIYDLRTDIGRDLKAEQARLAAVPVVAKPTSEPVVVADLMSQLKLAEEYLAYRAEHLEVMGQIRILRERLDSLDYILQSAPDPGHPDELRNQIANAEVINDAHRKIEERRKLQDSVAGGEADYKTQSERLTKLDSWKAEQLAQASMPVAGLGLDEDDQVTYNGVPFSQASGAERLRTSLAIAMAANPQMRVIRITDGSLLDSDNMDVIKEMAQEENYQVWIEVVGDRDDVQVLIDDGEQVAK